MILEASLANEPKDLLSAQRGVDGAKPTQSGTDSNGLSSTTAASSLPHLLQTFQEQLERIDAMEQRLSARTVHARRRLSTRLISDLNFTPTSTTVPTSTPDDSLRQSHVRLYVSHAYTPEVTAAGAMAALMQKQVDNAIPLHSKPSPPIWTLYVEGKLLVDQLDSGPLTSFNRSTVLVDPRRDENASQAQAAAAAATDTSLKPPPKLCFTHLFDKVTVTFQTIFALANPKPSSSTPKKKSRRTSSTNQNTASTPTAKSKKLDEEDVRHVSHKTTLVWNLRDTEDAHVWSFAYPEPPPPDPRHQWKVHAVVAQVQLVRRTGYATRVPPHTTQPPQQPPFPRYARYRVCSTELQAALFPHYGPVSTDLLTGLKRSSATTESADTVPTHNQVHVPHSLSMSDIATAFYTYIAHRRLIHRSDKTSGDTGGGDVVQCDTVLSNLLGMEQFSFSQLQQLLFQRNLIQLVNTEEPIDITYMLEQHAAVASVVSSGPMVARGSTHTSTRSNDVVAVTASTDPSILQVDVDIRVPSFYSYRIHALWGRMQRRAMEYSRCRSLARMRLGSTTSGTATNHPPGSAPAAATAAAAALAASSSAQSRRMAQVAHSAAKEDDERLIRSALEACVTSPETCGPDSIPLFLALAQSARPQSDARVAAQLDARISYLVGELQERLPRVMQARSTIQACNVLGSHSQS